MSHIFDALLKSENEHSAGNGAGLASITEVLKQAEQRAAAQLKPAPDQHAANGKPSAPPALPVEDAIRVAASASVTVPAAALRPAERVVTPARVASAMLTEARTIDSQTIDPLLPPAARLVAYTDNGSPGAEAFRLLAVRLRHIRRDRQLKKLLITSTVPQEGKSLTSANLACVLSAGGAQKVLLLEGDIRRPSLTELFQLSDRPGLCDWLRGRSTIENCIYRVAGPEFWILPCGRVQGNPVELIQSARISDLLEDSRTLFDWIIIDSPPVLPLADTSILAKMADGILLVTRRGVTEKKHLERGLEALEKGKLLGTVINSSLKPRHDYYYYGARSAGQSPTDPLL